MAIFWFKICKYTKIMLQYTHPAQVVRLDITVM